MRASCFAMLAHLPVTILVAAATALAQIPPSLIRIHRTPEQRATSPIVHAHRDVISIALRPVTGGREIWQIELHPSFAAVEQADNASPVVYDNEFTRTSIAFHRNWWSTRPEDAFQILRRARYLQVTVIRIPVQAESELNELLRGRRASLDSINLDRPDIVYQILSGDQSGTFFILSPLQSLAALDEGVGRSAAAYLRSTGSPSQRSGAANLKSDISHENLIFRVDPQFSRTTLEFAEADPAFWKGSRE